MTEPRRYIVPLRRRLFGIIMGILIGLLLLVPVVGIAALGIGFTLDPENPLILPGMVVLFVVTMLGAIGYFLGPFPFMIAFLRRPYLEVTEDGFLYDSLPLFRYRCEWENVESLEKIGQTDVLVLAEAETDGMRYWLNFYRRASKRNQHIVSLRVFDEWPDGALQADLRRFVPHLFEDSNQEPD
ncbi:MAG: hypothetical protein GYB68_14565 [Chloroflexi bacterium]|nr:hypothetical protein [Chloroflexota bacterium]